MGDVVLGEILKAKHNQLSNADKRDKFYVVIADEVYRPQAMSIVQKIRDVNFWSVDYSFVPMKVGKQFQVAEGKGCSFAVVVDSQAATGVVEVQEFETRTQTKTTIDNIILHIQAKIGDRHGRAS